MLLTGAATTTHAGCTSYAQGSARVTSPVAPYSVALQTAIGDKNIGMLAKPVSQQIAAHLATTGGSFGSKDLVLVLAGANDIFMILGTVNPSAPSTITSAVSSINTAADEFVKLVKEQVVAKGAQRVLVLNLPDIAQTPFGVSKGTTGQGLITMLVDTFNARLASGLAGVAGVRLGDAHAENQAQFANPAQYGVSTMAAVACGPNALSNPSTANGTGLVCNTSNVVKDTDISGYFFADYVHPTPLGHKLLSQFVNRELIQAGWM